MKNKNRLFGITTLFGLVTLITSCAPTGDQIKKLIEQDPSIVFTAIEKAPDQFIEVVNNAAREGQKRQQEKAMAEQNAKREEEFKNPLTPKIDESRTIFGAKTAKITIVEYSDFECPYCSRGYATVKQVLKEYPTQVRVLFKHLPLDFHPQAMPAAKIFEALAKQSQEKAMKLHDAIFENQDKLRQGGEKWLLEQAKKLGANMDQLKKDKESDEVKKQIEEDMEEAKKFEMTGTPGFIVNGVSLKGAYPFSDFRSIIERHLAGSK